jgi:3-methyladenine DNA glycosylase AlkD
VTDLVATLRRGLAERGDPARAPGMQAYMKSTMPYRGVPTPARRRLVRDVIAAVGAPADRAAWDATVRELWDGAAFREERYVAVDLCGHRSARAWQDPDAVATYDHFVVTGAWWDHVDAVAIGLIGPILRSHRAEMEPIVRSWITDADPWRRRTAILVQNGAKAQTDTALLADAILASVDDRDFFLRKGIGWALREYAKTDPEWVRTFVAIHADRLAPLSRREALKHLG